MTSRLAVVPLILGAACVALPPAAAQPEGEVVKETKVELPLGKGAWDLRLLDRDPIRLVSTTAIKRDVRLPALPPSPENPEKPVERPQRTVEQTSVEFVLEFERDLTVRDTDWTGVRPEPPYRFDFLDKDGVTLLSESARYEGIPVGRKGRRVRVVLTMPAPRVLSRVAKILVEPKRYSDLPQ